MIADMDCGAEVLGLPRSLSVASMGD